MVLESREIPPLVGNILGIGGSPRKGGNTDTLLGTILGALLSETIS